MEKYRKLWTWRERLLLSVILAPMSIIGSLSTTIYVPCLLLMRKDLGCTTFQLNVTMALFQIVLSIFPLVWGQVSDRIGRKRVLLSTLALYSLTSLLCSISWNIYALWLFRTLQGIGISAAQTVCLAIFDDIYPTNWISTAIGFFSLSYTVGPLVAPLLGGVIGEYYHWRYIFVFLSLISFPLLIPLSFIQETVPSVGGIKKILAADEYHVSSEYIDDLMIKTKERARANAFSFRKLEQKVEGVANRVLGKVYYESRKDLLANDNMELNGDEMLVINTSEGEDVSEDGDDIEPSEISLEMEVSGMSSYKEIRDEEMLETVKDFINHMTAKPSLLSSLAMVKSPPIVFVSLVFGFLYGMTYILIINFPTLVYSRDHFSSSKIGLAMFPFCVSTFVGSFLGGFLSDKMYQLLGREARLFLLVVGVLIFSSAFLFLGWLTRLSTIFSVILACICGFGQVIGRGGAITYIMNEIEGAASSANGFFMSVMFGFCAFFSLVSAPLGEVVGIEWLFVVGAVCLLLSMVPILVLLIVRRRNLKRIPYVSNFMDAIGLYLAERLRDFKLKFWTNREYIRALQLGHGE